jgi:putative (di)nucleoside polyphosphate hydrolase
MNVEDLPYRPCVGVMLVNQEGRIFVGLRIDQPAGEAWQMPQGGIDEGEEPRATAVRELWEETGITADQVSFIAEARREYHYDLPPELLGKIWRGRWRGQRQHWFLYRFTGKDQDINLQTAHPEFSAWKWIEPAALPGLIVEFKRELYEQVLAEFALYLH